MPTTEFHEALGTLGIAQQRVAALFGVGSRSVRRWQDGERRVPHGVGIVVRLLAAGMVTVEQVERAANPISARTNGGAKSEPPVVESPSELEPALEQFALADAEAVTFADPDLTLSARKNGGAEPEPPAPLPLEPVLESSAPLAEPLTTAEKVAALTSRSCRWPSGDPQHPDFHFCGGAVVAPPYCDAHRALAYLAPPPTRWVRRRGRRRLYVSARGISWAG
jgi:GcrA cell cycle regulator